MFSFLAAGAILGLSAGFAPGPLLTLVISETLRHNTKAGIKVAIAPALTDLPIIFLTLYILAKLTHFQTVLGAISLIGGGLVLYLGFECICTKGVSINMQEIKSESLKKGVIVNMLSPHPYLFWFSVGAPVILKASKHSFSSAAAFLISFYGLLIGSKIFIAILVGKSRSFLKGKAYLLTMRLLGVGLLVFAFFLFRDGLNLLGCFD